MNRYRSLLFALLIVSTPAPGMAAEDQVDRAQDVTADSQEFFLLQAFHSNERKSLNHLGLIAEYGEQGYRISAVLDGFPAQQAGLRRGDMLVSIDGAPFHPVLSLNPRIADSNTTSKINGQIELEYSRDGVTSTVAMLPVFGNLFDAYRTATLNSTQQFSNGNKLIGYVKLWSLDRSANGVQWFRQLLDSLDHCDGLILDLRDSYGFIDASHIDPFFASRNSLFDFSGRNPDLWQRSQPRRTSTPSYGRAIAVIQNNGTRSGIELFSYQLARLQRVVSVGATTAGKAGRVTYNRERDVLTYQPLSEIQIDGHQLENRGFEPEVPVPYPLNESRAADPQLDAAVLALMEFI